MMFNKKLKKEIIVRERIEKSIINELKFQKEKLDKAVKNKYNAYGSMINFWTDEQRKHESVIESLERIIKENNI